jgi:hypothetical protein
MALSGHSTSPHECPHWDKPTSRFDAAISAFDPKRTSTPLRLVRYRKDIVNTIGLMVMANLNQFVAPSRGKW